MIRRLVLWIFSSLFELKHPKAMSIETSFSGFRTSKVRAKPFKINISGLVVFPLCKSHIVLIKSTEINWFPNSAFFTKANKTCKLIWEEGVRGERCLVFTYIFISHNSYMPPLDVFYYPILSISKVYYISLCNFNWHVIISKNGHL